MRKLYEQLRVVRRPCDTIGLCYIEFISYTKKGESSDHGAKRNDKNKKPT